MDILIPYRTSNTDELRYALRSIAKHIPKARVFIVGDTPDYLSNIYAIQASDRARTPHSDVYTNINLAINDERLSDDFVLWADDIFITDTFKGIPAWHDDDIDVIAKKKPEPYKTILLNTDKLLKANGISNPVSYALHIPMVINKTNLRHVYSLMATTKNVVSMRTLYGNLYLDTSAYHRDVKIYDKTSDLPKPFASAWENALGVAYKQLQDMYPEKCEYEK